MLLLSLVTPLSSYNLSHRHNDIRVFHSLFTFFKLVFYRIILRKHSQSSPEPSDEIIGEHYFHKKDTELEYANIYKSCNHTIPVDHECLEIEQKLLSE